MKITWKHGNRSIEFEHQPMQPERFAALLRLAGAAIGGGVLLGAIHMIGVWAVGAAVGALALVGVYKLLKKGF